MEEDAEGLRIFAAQHQELIVASSYSKNFGLYNERVGACTLMAADVEIADRAFIQALSRYQRRAFFQTKHLALRWQAA